MIPLLDTHQHLLYPDRARYAWSEGLPALSGKAFTLRDYHALTEGAGIGGTIFMEVDADDYRAEAAVIADLMTPESGLRGMILSCRPEAAGFVDWLDAAPSGVVGYRRILHETTDNVSQGDLFRANLREIGRRSLTFDMCFLARQLPIARDLARACPDVSLVLDHCGVPDIAGGGFEPWRTGIAELARLPNVTAKISGVLAYCTPDTATLATIRPYVEHVIASFGPERCLWGSDWPVVNKFASLPLWIEATRALLSELTETEASAIAHRTAERVYGVSL